MISARPVVLSIINQHPVKIGGVEMYLHELSRQLQEAGWASVVYLPSSMSPAVREYFDLPNLHVLSEPGLFHRSPRLYLHFVKALNRYQPRIVHLQFSGIPRFSPWLARLRGVNQFFYTDQDSRPEGCSVSPGWLGRRLLGRCMFAPVTARISISNYVDECNRRYALMPASRHIRIYNGVDLGRVATPGDGAAWRVRTGIPDAARVVMQVSAMVPEKGIDDLIDAAALVLAQDPTAFFVLVGEGKMRRQYQRKVEALGWARRVLFAGASADPFREGVFAAADIVCQLSRWEEAFGFSIAEAMAHGKAVVATRAGGIPELIDDRVCGRLVAKRDPAAATAAILELLRDRALCDTYGRAARERVRERFDMRVLVAQQLSLYSLGAAAGTRPASVAAVSG